MKSIEPFNKVWLDCYNNLKLSLLININPAYERRGYENIYEYSCNVHIPESGIKVNCISEEQYYVDFSDFAEVEKIKPQTEDEFLDIIMKHLKSDKGFVLIHIDLFDWFEGSICWQKYHWDHYSLIVDYNEKDDVFIAYDEAQAQYKSLCVKRKELYKHLSNNSDFEKVRLITIYDDVKLKPISVVKLNSNAQNIVNSIEKHIDRYFWEMEAGDYAGLWFRDLIGVYMQRIEGRQKANKMLMLTLTSLNEIPSKDQLYKWAKEFETLSNDWSTLRMGVYKVYLKEKGRAKILDVINTNLKKCLIHEKNLWEDFICTMNKLDNLDKIAL